jgi:hypothetical protein
MRKMLKFGYSAVEQALAKIYGASENEVRQTAFRARINSLQRLGVLGEKAKVGKGARLTYTVEQMERWLACMELCELGISPTVAGKLVIAYWAKKFAPIFRAAQGTVVRVPGPDDVILYLGGVHLMSGSWSSESDFPGVPNINHITVRKLPDHVLSWMDDAQRSRMLITNLSARLRQFHTALSVSHMTELEADKKRRKQ